MMMITVTYGFGKHTGTIIVQDWASALKCIAGWSRLDKMDFLRVQVSYVF